MRLPCDSLRPATASNHRHVEFLKNSALQRRLAINRLRFPAFLVLLSAFFALCTQSSAAASSRADAELAARIRADASLRQVRQTALDLLKSGVNAGTSYKAVWIRDMNTFIEAALEVNPPSKFREALLTFFKFQGADGNIVDLYFPTPADPARIRPSYRTTPLAPGLMADKNTVEVDEESSLVQAVYKYVKVTGDRSILDERIDGRTVQERLGLALHYLLTERFDAAHGLIWDARPAPIGATCSPNRRTAPCSTSTRTAPSASTTMPCCSSR